MKNVTNSIAVIDHDIKFNKENFEIENFDELLKEVNEELENISSIIITDQDSYSWARKQRADVRKKKDALSRIRIDEENRIKAQIETFSNQFKQLENTYANSDVAIKSQLDEYDEKLWQEKKKKIKKIIEEVGMGYDIEINNDWKAKKWTKSKITEEIAGIAKEIDEQVSKDKEAVESIENLATNLDIDPAGWVQQYKDGKELTNLLNDLSIYAAKKKEQEKLTKEEKAVEQQNEPVDDTTVEEDKESNNDFLSFINAQKAKSIKANFRFEGTQEELDQLDVFIKSMNINLTRV